MNTLFILGAKYLIFVSIFIGSVYFLKQSSLRKKKMFILGTLSLLIAGSIAFVAGHLYNNPRPFVVDHFIPLIPHTGDNGFPSDHTLLAASIAAIIFFFNKKVGFLLGLTALLLGVSRIYVGVHHGIDVLGSFLIAIVAVCAAQSAISFFTNHPPEKDDIGTNLQATKQ